MERVESMDNEKQIEQPNLESKQSFHSAVSEPFSAQDQEKPVEGQDDKSESQPPEPPLFEEPSQEPIGQDEP